jgi:ribosome-associated translation inhibitor RaiA
MTRATIAFDVEGDGTVTTAERDYAHLRVNAALEHARDPVLHVRVRLTRAADPAVERRAEARVQVDLNGRPLHAHAARASMTEAIDEMHDRIRDQIQRAAHDWEAMRGALPNPGEHEWRHESVPRSHGGAGDH